MTVPRGDRHTANSSALLRSVGLRATASGAELVGAASAFDGGSRAEWGPPRTAVHLLPGRLRRVARVRRSRATALVRPPGQPALFERRAGDNHHHLVCRRCGRTEDTDRVVGVAPCLTPHDRHGFAVDEAEILFWGLCGSCQTGRADPGTTHHHEEIEEIGET
jgi:hypothetical protein